MEPTPARAGLASHKTSDCGFALSRAYGIMHGGSGMAADQIAFPEWTDYRHKSALDPLRMQNRSINL
jgi:hypothetical protein